MNKKLLTLALVAVATATAGAQNLKFGHFDSQKFLIAMPEVKQVQSTIDSEATKIEGQLTILQEDFTKMQQDYQNNAPKLTEEQLREKETELNETYQKIQNFVATSRQQLEAKQRELMAPIMQRLLRTVQEVGSENGFTYIFEQQAGLTVYVSQKSTDIAPLVKAKLGIN